MSSYSRHLNECVPSEQKCKVLKLPKSGGVVTVDSAFRKKVPPLRSHTTRNRGQDLALSQYIFGLAHSVNLGSFPLKI